MRQKESQVVRNSLGGSSSSSVKRKHSESNRRML
jgi:hypothetical protein